MWASGFGFMKKVNSELPVTTQSESFGLLLIDIFIKTSTQCMAPIQKYKCLLGKGKRTKQEI